MIVRTAIVFWWCGLLIGLFVTSSALLDAFERSDCTTILSLRSAIEADHNAAVEKYQRDHPSPAGYKPDSVQALLEAAVNTPPDGRDTPKLQVRGAFCETPFNILPLVFGWACVLMLWTLAYIAGGSFWLPQKRRA
ncbi:hypothetical protein RCH10_003775 [Variovorax sp. GrIS 2.14]|uniref:hypothetical protein n=1 Tax=Variovorax sp. GrIS 2.14 TaxID=3071709 RepID=UPI0038F6F6EE